MKKLILLIMSMIIVAGCSPSQSQVAAGEFNLSKGQCIDIPDCQADGACEPVSDEMTYESCQVVNGTFVPRDHKKTYWF